MLKFLKYPEGIIAAAGDGTAGAGEKSATPVTMTLVMGCVNTGDPKKSSAGSFEVTKSGFTPRGGKNGHTMICLSPREPICLVLSVGSCVRADNDIEVFPDVGQGSSIVRLVWSHIIF